MQKGDIVYININSEHLYVRLTAVPEKLPDGLVIEYDKSWGLQMGPAMSRDGRMVMQKSVMDLSEELGTTASSLFIPKDKIYILADMNKSGKMYASLLAQATGLALPVK